MLSTVKRKKTFRSRGQGCGCVSVSSVSYLERGEESVGKLPNWKGSKERRLMGIEGEALSMHTTYPEEHL